MFWYNSSFDICTKNWVVENAFELRHNPIVVLEGQSDQKSFLEFTYVTNPGAAWSMLSDYPMVLTVVALAPLCYICFPFSVRNLQDSQSIYIWYDLWWNRRKSK